jgi:CDP-diglyceride synthetase
MNALPSSFLPRTLSTVFLWLGIIAAYALHSEIVFGLLIALPALGALWEYFALLRSGGIAHHRGFGMGTALVLIGLNFWLLRSSQLFPRVCHLSVRGSCFRPADHRALPA